MRTYEITTIQQEVLKDVICNMCGGKIPVDKYGYVNDYIRIDKTWGYNSDFDGLHHSIDICAACYQKWIEQFAIGVDSEDRKNREL